MINSFKDLRRGPTQTSGSETVGFIQIFIRQTGGAVTAMLFVAGVTILAGCDMRTKDRVMDFKPDPIGPAKAILRAYADGQPVGSESETFDSLVSQVAEADPDKGMQLREFFERVKRAGKASRKEAKKVLDKLD